MRFAHLVTFHQGTLSVLHSKAVAEDWVTTDTQRAIVKLVRGEAVYMPETTLRAVRASLSMDSAVAIERPRHRHAREKEAREKEDREKQERNSDAAET